MNIGGERQIDRGAVEVERVARGQHEAHDALVAAERFELDDEARQHGFGRRCREHDQQFLAQVAQQAPEREAVQARERAEHAGDEQHDTQGRTTPSSTPSEPIERMPKRPTVNAIAPNAPSGASRMIIARMRNSTCATASINSCTRRPRFGLAFSANPNSSASSSTGSTSPFSNAPTSVSGITCSAKSTSPCASVRVNTARGSLASRCARIDVQARARMKRERRGEPENERDGGQRIEQHERLQDRAPDRARRSQAT